MNISTRYLKWLAVLVPITCAVYADPLELNGKIEFTKAEAAYLNASISGLGPVGFFAGWEFVYGPDDLTDNSKVNNVTGQGNAEDDSDWGLLLDTNEGKLSVKIGEEGLPLGDDSIGEDQPFLTRWISMDVRFAPCDVRFDLNALVQEDGADIAPPRLAVCAEANTDGTAQVLIGCYDKTVYGTTEHMDPIWVETGYNIDPAKVYTLVFETKGLYEEYPWVLPSPLETAYRINIIDNGVKTCLTLDKGFRVFDSIAEFEGKLEPAPDGQGGDWVLSLDSGGYGQNNDPMWLFRKIQFEGTGWVDNLAFSDTEPEPPTPGNEMPEDFVNAGVTQTAFDAWVADYSINVSGLGDGSLDAFLLNVDPTGTVPELKIASITVEDGNIMIVVSAEGVNLATYSGESTETHKGIHGILCVYLADSLTEVFAGSDASIFDFTVDNDGAATVVIPEAEAKFIKATVEATSLADGPEQP